MRRVCTLGLLISCGADWPHVCGPGYDAHSAETGLADHWPASGPPVLWTRELGAGYSAFVVAGGRAFTLYQTAAGMFLTALDADTGAEVWRERVDWPWQPGGLYPGPYASPTVHANRVYYATPYGRVGCVEAGDGRAVWAVDVRARFGGKGTEFGYASTPLVDDGRVILPVGGPGASLVALNAADGSTVWANGDDPASYAPAYPVTIEGRRLVVGFLQNSLVVHDPATGERLWRQRLSGSYDEHAAWPLCDGRHLLVASPFRTGSRLFRLSAAEGRIVGTEVWSGRQLSNDVCSSLLHAGAVYGFDLHQSQASTHRPSRGVFKCLDFATGAVRWETEAVGQATPLVADGKLVIWAETGELILIRPTTERYEELARTRVLGDVGMCWAAPALADKRLFVRDHKRAACVYLGPAKDLDPARRLAAESVNGRPFDWSRLLPREPDFPNDSPTVQEVGRWFVACAGVFAVTGLIAVSVPVRSARRWVFAVTAAVLGAIGTTAAGAVADTFLLTWPVSLYVAFRSVIAFGSTAATPRRRLAARLALLLFAVGCYGYYRLCLVVGYAMAWGYLAGFVVAAPFALTAHRVTDRRLRLLIDTAGFAAYFWVSGLLPGWKAMMRQD